MSHILRSFHLLIIMLEHPTGSRHQTSSCYNFQIFFLLHYYQLRAVGPSHKHDAVSAAPNRFCCVLSPCRRLQVSVRTERFWFEMRKSVRQQFPSSSSFGLKWREIRISLSSVTFEVMVLERLPAGANLQFSWEHQCLLIHSVAVKGNEQLVVVERKVKNPGWFKSWFQISHFG